VSRQWYRQPERGTQFAIKLIVWIALHLGRLPARLLLYPISAYFVLTAGCARRVSGDYFARVWGRRPGWWNFGRHLHCYATTILDRVFLLSGRHGHLDVRVHNGEVLLERLRAGQGCLLLGAHLGSFEVLRTLAVDKAGFPLKILMDKGHNPIMTRLLDALNPATANIAIGLGSPDALLKVSECLAQGGMVGMLGDRVAKSDKVTRCRFLGAEAVFPAGPMLVASALKAPVILCFGLYRGGNRYDVYFELLAEQVTIKRPYREADVQHWVQRYAERLECYVRSAPYNWFNFYDYWDLNSVS